MAGKTRDAADREMGRPALVIVGYAEGTESAAGTVLAVRNGKVYGDRSWAELVERRRDGREYTTLDVIAILREIARARREGFEILEPEVAADGELAAGV
jgi:hypothetical protein